MPLGGINAGWDETVPPDSENAGLGAQRIRSLETSVQQILDSEHNFPASGGANTGYHRLGSARVFYGTKSTVSSSGTDGRLMQTSDSSQLFHVGSAGTVFLGGTAVPTINDWALGGGGSGTGLGGLTYPQKTIWAIDTGADLNGADGNAISFSTAYSGIPIVVVSAVSQRLSAAAGYLNVQPYNITTTGFSYRLYFTSATPTVIATSHCSVNYVSIGTRLI